MSVESVKDKLWRKCGTSVNSMSLELYDDTNVKVAALTDNSTPLGFYSPLNGLVFLFIYLFFDACLLRLKSRLL